jgi:hypothetical protein
MLLLDKVTNESLGFSLGIAIIVILVVASSKLSWRIQIDT